MRHSLPSLLLRLEGVAVLIVAVFLYVDGDYSIWPLLVFALAPDLALLAYLAGPRAGATGYDLAHTYAPPIVFAAVGVVADVGVLVQIALIWAAHIGADRLLGYGLKYETGFKETHLQRI
jgi:uncharacterized protein DUF4260